MCRDKTCDVKPKIKANNGWCSEHAHMGKAWTKDRTRRRMRKEQLVPSGTKFSGYDDNDNDFAVEAIDGEVRIKGQAVFSSSEIWGLVDFIKETVSGIVDVEDAAGFSKANQNIYVKTHLGPLAQYVSLRTDQLAVSVTPDNAGSLVEALTESAIKLENAS